ncbi:unnamed protein product [Tilletia controversa]|uniref:Pre-mRNA-processing factor 19 n=2 Tax=Tilletia TaxID=13289 RepID=A0A177U671_9BASI|nr:hypothetical protein CF335_g4977 [Tilletia laevis]KAE8256530.1 hypothetical protein A4X03_0g5316 [Tilletia caries]CAD6909981.1 unnamed protein product [Tilletia controversa]CAD6893457.1 unnamed protein product [Tilletia caries]CAD6915041.1 unnamed protein product [Tilletia controversa]
MFCAISGEPPQEPVVNKNSGQLYERRLILKYIADNQSDPITGQPLAEDDLVVLKASPKTAIPRPPTLSSVPALLVSLQNEYDAVILEAFTLKKQYDAIRQELTHLLYQNDAANRVIARLMNERDQARDALSNIQASLGTGAVASLPPTGDSDMTDAAGASSSQGVSEEVGAILTQTAERLSTQRRAKSKRKAPEGYTTAADLQQTFEQIISIPSMHSTKPPGITSLDLSPATSELALTGGNDKVVQIYNRQSGKVSSTLKGHTKKINAVAWTHNGEIKLGEAAAPAEGEDFNPAHAVSGSEDGSVRVWAHKGDGTYALSHTLVVSPASGKTKSPVVGVAVHPCGTIVGAATRDGHWALFDMLSGDLLLRVGAPEAGSEPEDEAEGGYEYASFAFHPDGGLLAAGTRGGVVRVWNVSSGTKASTFRTQLSGELHSLSFSENGYYLAVAAASSADVEVWDLRKVTMAASIAHPAGSSLGPGAIQAVAFDPSAQFLAVVGPDVRVYANKSWALLASWEENAAEVTSVRWDLRDGSLVVGGLDRTLRVLGTKKA